MQGIDKIIEKIVSDAKADAKETQKQTKKQIDDVRASHEKQTKKQIDELKKESAEKMSLLESRSKTMADLEKRRNMLAVKRELVEESFSLALKNLKSLESGMYLTFIEKLMRNLDDRRGEVIVGKGEKNITQAFIDKINEKTDSSYELAEKAGNFEGGFVLRNGKVETNCTLDMLVSQAKRELEQEVAAVLFNESGA